MDLDRILKPEEIIDRLKYAERQCVKGYYYILIRPDVRDRIIELLKEQETKKGHWIVLEFCANEGIYCSECHMKIFDRTTKPKEKLSKYCPHCGSRNEEFFRDGEVVFR